jgi:RNA polymerase sigma factor (TIGR02999 family)
LLGEIHRGNASAYDALLPLVYDELKRVASRSLLHEQDGHTLQPTALVHEAYLRLVDQSTPNFENRRHFFSVSAALMRQILVDHARRANAAKRGFRTVIPLEDFMDAAAVAPELHEILELDEAIQQLAARDTRQAQIVELRYFAGLSVQETAAALNVSERTVKRDWAVARAFLYRALDGASEG